MSKMGLPEGLLCRDVIRLGKKKAVVVKAEHQSDTVAITWLPVIGGGTLVGRAEGWTSLTRGVGVLKLGIWRGPVSPGATGYVESINDPDGSEGSGQMATKTKTAKKGKKTAAKKSSSNGGESKRASNEELDKLAAKVVELRDEKDLSWGEIQEQLDIAPSRLRSLYNRGGGEATRERKGAAKKKAEASAKKAAGKNKKRSRKGSDPSDED